MSIDTLDMKIINLLQRDARIPYVEIAKTLGVNEATVRKRIIKLKAEGIIERFTTILDYHKLGRAIKTFVGLRIQPTKLKEITDHLSVNPDIHVLYRTSGDMDVLAEVIFEKMEDLNQFLENELNLDGILGTNVMIVIGPYKKCPWTGL
jgi:Lrp/AsnC family transcriptional regulator for asnA, asnC and gidA